MRTNFIIDESAGKRSVFNIKKSKEIRQ